MLNIQPRCLWSDCLVERMQQLIDDGSFKFDISLGNLCDLVNVVLLEIFLLVSMPIILLNPSLITIYVTGIMSFVMKWVISWDFFLFSSFDIFFLFG